MSATLAQSLLWLAAIGLPLLVAAGLGIPRWRGWAGSCTPWAPLPALLAALWHGPGGELHLKYVLLGARLGLDETGRGFLLLTALLWLLAGWFARGYLAGDRRAVRFHLFWLLALSGNIALVLARDMPGYYAGFAMMSFSSYGLVVHTAKPEALHAGRVYLFLVVVGELLLFAGLVMLAQGAGGVTFRELEHHAPDRLAAGLILLGFGIKAGALPLHGWLPLAHPAAPVPASAVLSGAMIKAGLLGWLRFVPPGGAGLEVFSGPLMVAGLAAVFLAAVAGVAQSNAKTVLAYSSISQMGIMTVAMGAALLGSPATAEWVAALTLYALHHGLAKGALFLGVGLAAVAVTGGQRRLLGAGVLFVALALAGAPLTSGAVAKLALKHELGSLPSAWPALLGWLLPLAAVGTTLLMARFLVLLWRTKPERAHGHRPGAMWLSWSVLLLVVGTAAWLGPDASRRFAGVARPDTLWSLSWPVLIGAAMAWFAAERTRGKSPASRWWPQIPPGDLVVMAERVIVKLRRLLPSGAARAGGERFAATAVSAGRRVAGAASGWCDGRSEIYWRAWPRVGAILALLAGLVLAAFAMGGTS